jgi:hypothetical protein
MFGKRLKKIANIILYHLVTILAALVVVGTFTSLSYLSTRFISNYLDTTEGVSGTILLVIFGTLLVYIYVLVLLKVWRFIDWLFLEPYRSWRESEEE